MKGTPQQRALLHNLAIRARKVRQQHKRYSQSMQHILMSYFDKGAEMEAWNSFQAAKQIVFGEGRLQRPLIMKLWSYE